MKAKRLPRVLAGGLVLLLASCNRGFGCPTNLSLDGVVGWLLSFGG